MIVSLGWFVNPGTMEPVTTWLLNIITRPCPHGKTHNTNAEIILRSRNTLGPKRDPKQSISPSMLQLLRMVSLNRFLMIFVTLLLLLRFVSTYFYEETRPKVPDTDEQDANEENDASALLKGRSFTPACGYTLYGLHGGCFAGCLIFHEEKPSTSVCGGCFITNVCSMTLW